MTSEAMGKAQGMTLTASSGPTEGSRSNSHRNALICALVVTVCALITYPVADMPFSDGFSYSKTALDFARTGHFLYNGWATAMLGWLIPWGALFIKIFGFSFNVMRFSMLPIDFATVYLLHQILRRFGLTSGNAIFGTFAFALSPIFMPSAVGFMTDVPGMLVIFLCIYMCQRAVATPSDRNAVLWLTAATLINVSGGTVRQIAWLGVLVMVPATAWLLRERHGMKPAGILLWFFGLIGVLVCLHWFNRQPYSVPEHLIWASIHPMTLVHLEAQIVKTFFCFLLVILPITVAWLPSARSLSRKSWLWFAGGMIFAALLLFTLAHISGRPSQWLMPWLEYLLLEQSSLVPGMWGTPAVIAQYVRIAVSLFVIAAGILMLVQLANRGGKETYRKTSSTTSWRTLAWILGPFSLSYFLLLMPRGAFNLIQDRYLVGLTPIAAIVLLRVYQERVRPKLPLISIVTLAIFAVYSVAGTHDYFARSRALVKSLQVVENSGVPRTSIQTSFPDDGWVQIQNGGHINEPRIQVPAGAYNPNPPSPVPEKCRDWFTTYSPIIVPKYFLLFPQFKNPPFPAPPWCYVHANYPPVHITEWLPPFHQTMYVEKLGNNPHIDRP